MKQNQKKSPFIIGIDLGTTNSTVSYINTKDKHSIQVFEIPQLTDDNTVKPQSILPSFLYLPESFELPENAASLPWQKDMSKTRSKIEVIWTSSILRR